MYLFAILVFYFNLRFLSTLIDDKNDIAQLFYMMIK